MLLNIDYNNKLSSKNNNFFIFVSNLSQLKNIDFLPNMDFYLKDKEFLREFELKKYSIITKLKSNDNFLLNIMIFLVNPLSKSNYEIGSIIYNQFPFSKHIKKKNISFFFSSLLKSKHKSSIAEIIFGFSIKCYSFNKYKNNLHLSFFLNLYNLKEFKELNYKLNLVKSINFTKDLVSEPANILNPKSYALKCNELKKFGIKVKILDTNQINNIGMRALLGVAQGSVNSPRVVIFEWNLKKGNKPVILVGKGVTFDSGGISIKPSNGMEEMIMDMGGSAVVVGSMMNAALNNSSKSIVGIIGLVENMPDGKAQRPGDIIKSLSKHTIEIINTDAEGRLVLADILTYIQRKYEAKIIIDFATLTGAIMIALGTHRAGLFSNNDNLAKKLLEAGNISGEKLWRLPLGEEYDDEINSIRADMKNIGSTRFGGSIHAAQFIQRFIHDNIPWAHLDIAGVSWIMKSNNNTFSKLHSPGATAFGVNLIDKFLRGK